MEGIDCNCKNKKHTRPEDHLNCGLCVPFLLPGYYRRKCPDCGKWALVSTTRVILHSCGRSLLGIPIDSSNKIEVLALKGGAPGTGEWKYGSITDKLPAVVPADR